MTDSLPTHRFPIRPVLLLATAGVAIAAAGCHRHDRSDRSVAVTTRLDCPQEQGDLNRTDAAADGRSCRYTGPDGQEVTLAYLALDGRSPQDALKATEADLRSAVPATAAPEPGSLRPASDDAADDDVDKTRQGDRDDEDEVDGADHSSVAATPGAPTPPKPPEPPQVDRTWSSGVHGDAGDRVRINLPFLHVDADGSGRAHVRTFGVDVNADGDGAVVHTPGGGAIDARHGGAEMRFGSVGRRRADLMYIVASDHAGPQGFHSGAYVAKGPADGPLVLAVVRSRHDTGGAHDGDLHDVKRLVNRNVRGGRGDFDFNID